MRIWYFDIDVLLRPSSNNQNRLVPDCLRQLRKISGSLADWAVVVSNRPLDILKEIVSINDVILGGNNGLEWRLPNGSRIFFGADKSEIVSERRATVLALVSKLADDISVHMEDRYWSLYFSILQTPSSLFALILAQLKEIDNISIEWAANGIEVHFLPEHNRSIAMAYLSKLLNVGSNKHEIIYIGSGTNDEIAIWWTLMAGGTAIVMEQSSKVPGVLYAHGFSELTKFIEDIWKH